LPADDNNNMLKKFKIFETWREIASLASQTHFEIFDFRRLPFWGKNNEFVSIVDIVRDRSICSGYAHTSQYL
jgi:hypothetical protein